MIEAGASVAEVVGIKFVSLIVNMLDLSVNIYSCQVYKDHG